MDVYIGKGKLWHHLISELYSELGFFERLTAIEKEFPGANVILHKDGYMPKVINISRELISNYIHIKLWDVINHPWWFS